jgi:hypothetical protein
MASSILNSDDGVISGTSGLKSTGGDDGVLVFQSKGTETARINTDKQIVAAAGTASLPIYSTTGDLNTGIFFPAADTIAFAEGGAEAMRIDSSGVVNIKNTGNTADFVTETATSMIVGNGSGTHAMIVYSGTSSNGALYFADGNTGNDTYRGGVQYLHGSDAMRFYTSATERMRIDSSGNVGIGTTSPTAGFAYNSNTRMLAVAGSGAASGASFGILGAHNNRATPTVGDTIGALNFLSANNTGPLKIDVFGVLTGSGGATGGFGADLVFALRGDNSATITERMRIDSSGNVLVGTTSAATGTNANGMYITSDGIAIVRQEAGTCAIFRRWSTNGAIILFRNTLNSEVGNISTSASATAYNTSSDYRLKHDIQPMTGALAKVQQLKPVTYKWNADDSDGEGFIAHELQEVAPYAVTGEKDGEQMQGVDYGKITPLLTAALQEAIAEIQSLKARVAELEAK